MDDIYRKVLDELHGMCRKSYFGSQHDASE